MPNSLFLDMRLLVVILFLVCSCAKNDVPSPSKPKGSGSVSSSLRLQVSELSLSGTSYIVPATMDTHHIFLELQPSGRYILDGGVNECNGFFTTDFVMTMDFQDEIKCTQSPGDQDSFMKFKEALTSIFTRYQVNNDTSQVRLYLDDNHYSKLLRVR